MGHEERATVAGSELAYADFGRRFFEYAVTRERVEAALSKLAGNEIDFGPRKIGPGGVASVCAQGAVREPKVVPAPGELVRFAITIPIELELVVRVAAHDHRFQADMQAHLTLTARAREPLTVWIDVGAPTEDDVEVDVEARGLRASVLDLLADIDGELRRVVADHIRTEIDKPDIRDMREIDVAKRLKEVEFE